MQKENNPSQISKFGDLYLIEEKIDNEIYYVPSLRVAKSNNHLVSNPTTSQQQYSLYGNWTLTLPGHSSREIITDFNSVVNQNQNYFLSPDQEGNITYKTYNKYTVSITITGVTSGGTLISNPYIYIYYNGNAKQHTVYKFDVTWTNIMKDGDKVHFKIQNNDSRQLTFYGNFITYNT